MVSAGYLALFSVKQFSVIRSFELLSSLVRVIINLHGTNVGQCKKSRDNVEKVDIVIRWVNKLVLCFRKE